MRAATECDAQAPLASGHVRTDGDAVRRSACARTANAGRCMLFDSRWFRYWYDIFTITRPITLPDEKVSAVRMYRTDIGILSDGPAGFPTKN